MGFKRYCFAKAIKLDPNSAIINLEEGFFCWQWDNKMDEGLQMIPEQMKHRDQVKWMQEEIDTGLRSR